MVARRAVVGGLLATAVLPAIGHAARKSASKATIVPFETTPFPYRGMLPDGSAPFLDVNKNGRLGHTSPRGGIYWEDETYSDRSTLLGIPKGFDPAKPGVIVVFLHGNQATLERDVVKRQRVFAQTEASDLNAVLVAPQFAVNALDSSAGSFWNPGIFGRFISEAAGQLATLSGVGRGIFDDMPIVLAAYSGGYNPAAYLLKNGDVDRRIVGVIMLDAVFAEEDKFARWIAAHKGRAFFVSAYGKSSASGNADLMQLLAGRDVAMSREAPGEIAAGTIAFIQSHSAHDSFVTRAFVNNPLQWLLSRVAGYRR